jgi:hypothetical protein
VEVQWRCSGECGMRANVLRFRGPIQEYEVVLPYVFRTKYKSRRETSRAAGQQGLTSLGGTEGRLCPCRSPFLAGAGAGAGLGWVWLGWAWLGWTGLGLGWVLAPITNDGAARYLRRTVVLYSSTFVQY